MSLCCLPSFVSARSLARPASDDDMYHSPLAVDDDDDDRDMTCQVVTSFPALEMSDGDRQLARVPGDYRR